MKGVIKMDRDREILVCTACKEYIFANSAANQAPQWTGKIGDAPETREEIGGQDDLRDFKRKHQKHELIEVNPHES